MRKTLKVVSTLLFVSALCACQYPDVAETAEVSRPSQQAETAELPGLGPQTLDPGDCGLFLWSRTDARTFVFFHRAGEATAKFFDDDHSENVTIAGVGGTLFGQFHSSTDWILADGRSFELMLEPGEELDGGQRVSGGVLTLVDADGWRTKTPVSGVRACQPTDGAAS